MNINLKSYQEEAITRLVSEIKKLLSKNETKKVCVFQAPTGSGKTIMTAKFIEEIIKENIEKEICFLWVTIGKGDLHIQSAGKLKKIFRGSPKVCLIEEEFSGQREKIKKNEVVVINWEKLRSKDKSSNEWKNILMKDGEKINFREVLKRTRKERKIIAIIDESHIGATAERTNELKDEINPDVILEMSATPKFQPSLKEIKTGDAAFIFVDPYDVIQAGIIKKEIIINENIDKIDSNENDSQEVILAASLKKRVELKDYFNNEGSNINPLVLVQIPSADAGIQKIEAIKLFLKKNNISEENGKVAIWLSDYKSEFLDDISENDNKIEYLIFKQAIDTGWDCPRAHILVKFRESKSEIFEIQTVGRILRMPEAKHYKNDNLNIGYIYTNIQSIIVKKEDYNFNIIKNKKSKILYNNEKVDLLSYYKPKIEFGDVTAEFTEVFSEIACLELGIKDPELLNQNIQLIEKKGINLDIKLYQQDIIKNEKITSVNFDELKGVIKPHEQVKLQIAGNDLQNLFEEIIANNLGSFKNYKRSIPKVKTAIYIWFRRFLGSKNWSEEIMLTQKIFVTEKNRIIFEKILSKSLEKLKISKTKNLLEKIEKNELFYNFELQNEQFYNENFYEQTDIKNYLYNPCYLEKSRSQPEKDFENFLNTNSDHIKWLWKNGENSPKYFGVKYQYPKEVIHTFYPDFIVKLNNNLIGIFEVKDKNDQDGLTVTKAKAEALNRYIFEHNNKNKSSLFGGIVISKNKNFIINLKKEYDWSKCLENNWLDWEDLNFSEITK